MKVRILYILTTFTQVTTRLKTFLVGWLLVLGLKEGLVECATVCVKSWVILTYINEYIPTKYVLPHNLSKVSLQTADSRKKF